MSHIMYGSIIRLYAIDIYRQPNISYTHYKDKVSPKQFS